MTKSLTRRWVDANKRASHWVDQWVALRLRVDGNQDFLHEFVWRYLRPGQTVGDVGGGKQPFLSVERKAELQCRVIGVDISSEELASAPDGAYDEVLVGDITALPGRGDCDVVLCQAVLEHVADVPAAIQSVASMLRPGGVCLLFVPCRNAPFARLSLLLPESLRRRILFGVFPETSRTQGFRPYYDQCTPAAIARLAVASGLHVAETRRYYMSSYFSFLLPLHVLWRLWTLAVVAAGAGDLCETFSMALEKPGHEGGLSGQDAPGLRAHHG